LEGGFVSKINKQIYRIMAKAGQIGSDYYPETAGPMYFVNASMLCTGVWSMCKGFLDERTIKKVKIVGTNF
jgi:hypothetical protein